MDMHDMRAVGRFVRDSRIDAGLTMDRAAELSGVSVRTLRSIETGKAPGVSFNNLLAVCDVVGIDLSMDVRHKRPETSMDHRDVMMSFLRENGYLG